MSKLSRLGAVVLVGYLAAYVSACCCCYPTGTGGGEFALGGLTQLDAPAEEPLEIAPAAAAR
jgi:hypothetical protein